MDGSPDVLPELAADIEHRIQRISEVMKLALEASGSFSDMSKTSWEQWARIPRSWIDENIVLQGLGSRRRVPET